MKIEESGIAGVWSIEYALHVDFRGAFARTFCRETFAAHGLEPNVAQCNLSRSDRRGTLRGMHLQSYPHGEAKLIRCVRGRVYDVALDLRPSSDTFCQWRAFELAEDEPRAVFLGVGIAHGFLTLTDNAELLYQMSAPYVPGAGRTVRWNDPAFGIGWPSQPLVMSDNDRDAPDYDREAPPAIVGS